MPHAPWPRARQLLGVSGELVVVHRETALVLGGLVAVVGQPVLEPRQALGVDGLGGADLAPHEALRGTAGEHKQPTETTEKKGSTEVLHWSLLGGRSKNIAPSGAPDSAPSLAAQSMNMLTPSAFDVKSHLARRVLDNREGRELAACSSWAH